jgi:Protein of unknown function (DUF2917)
MNARLIDIATECIVSLQAEEMARIHGAARLHIARGLLWLTIDGDPDDHVLRAGEGFTLGRGAHGLMQALNAPANVVIVEAQPSWPQRASAALQAASQRFVTVLA